MKKLLLLIGFASITMNAQVPSYVPTNGLVAYYPFNGNTNDVSGNNNNGTNNGATLTTDRFGNANSAYDFNGTSNFISVPDANSLDLTNQYSISVWIKIPDYSHNPSLPDGLGYYDYNRTILGKPKTSSWASGYELGLEDVGTTRKLYSAAANMSCCLNQAVYSQNAPSLNNWINIVSVYNGSVLKIFVNGVLDNSLTSTFTLDNSNQPLFIGKAFNSVGLNWYRWFKGQIDDIGIWNRAITQTEITSLYNANTCYQTVTDTLLINIGALNTTPQTYSNTISIYPNPAHDHITIDCGTLANVVGYHIEISNSLGQILFNQPMNTQQYTIALNSWTGTGLYFIKIYDASNNLIDTKKIILQ